jgi:membrane fusion protein (multidrug efflux system)
VGRWLVTSLGSQVTSQQPVVTIVDDEALRALAPLPTSQWLQVSESTAVRVKVGEEVREAKVIGIARAAEESSSRGTITVEIPNSDHKWKAGMVASIFFDLNVKPRIMVPAAALSITDEGSFVYVVDDGKAKRTPVEFQVIDNDTTEITKGLEAGAKIVVEGINQVGDGLAVNVVDDKPEAKQ